jgi:hypothetical protein
VTEAHAAQIWSILRQFGNDGDFFYGRGLWWLRRALDWLVGGPSFRRQRRHPSALRVGDVLDAWRVIECVPEERLTFLMELKAPGAGVLEFSVDDLGAERLISVRAYWHPAGVWGLLYWYATLPLHALLFRGTARRIAERAIEEDRPV